MQKPTKASLAADDLHQHHQHKPKVIPLTSKICLVIHEPQKDPKTVYTTVDKKLIRKINHWIVKYSERCVYSPDKGKIEKIAKTKKELLKPALSRFKVS